MLLNILKQSVVCRLWLLGLPKIASFFCQFEKSLYFCTRFWQENDLLAQLV